MSYNGWMIPDSERARILAAYPPAYPVVKASHVTCAVDDDIIPRDAKIVIVGHVIHDGVEALVVEVDGTTERADGLIFHITLSLNEGRASKESNDVLAAIPYKPVEPFPIVSRAFVSRGNSYITTPLTSL